MKEYLAIVLRNHFNLLYRFGYGNVAHNQLIPFDGTFNESLDSKVIDCFSKLTPFEYDEEYLILHISVASNEPNLIEIHPEDIVAIYPLSKQAKVSIESKIDSRIKIAEPKFERAIEAVKDGIQLKSIGKAIDIIYKICLIDSTQKQILPINEILNGLEKRKIGSKGNAKISGTFWEILIAYDRYDYFPNTTLGFLYDVGNVFSYFKGKADGVAGTKLHQFLEKLNSADPNIKLNNIVSSIEGDDLTSKFVEENHIIGNGKFKVYLAAMLFLKWKDELRNPEKTLSSSSIFFNGKISFYNDYPQEVMVALFLLASFFGFNRFYDEYYRIANFRFFHSYESDEVTDLVKGRIASKQDDDKSTKWSETGREASEENTSNVQSTEVEAQPVDKVEKNNAVSENLEKKEKPKKGKARGKKSSTDEGNQPKLEL